MVISAMAEWEREEIPSRVSSSIPIRAKLGKPLGGQAVFGYSWQNKEFILNESEACIRKLIYEIFIKTRRKKATADELNKLGYRTRRGAPFSDTTVARLLRDTTAKGERIVNYTKSARDGKSVIRKSKCDWTVIACPQIISEQIWNKANSILDEQEARSTRVGRRSVYLLSGFVKCICAKKMYVKRTKLSQCDRCRIKIAVSDLENIIGGFLSDCVNNTKFTKLTKTSNDLLYKKQALLEETFNEKAVIEEKVQRYVEMRMDDKITKEHFTTSFYHLNTQIAQLEDLLIRLKSEIDSEIRQIRLCEEQISEAKLLAKVWDTLMFEKNRAIIETVTRQIVISKKDVHIELSINLHSFLNGKDAYYKRLPVQSRSHFEMKVRKPLPLNYPEHPGTVGEQIRKKRIEEGISQLDLSKIIGVSADCISNWENNRNKPQIAYYPKIHKFLGFSTIKIDNTRFPGRIEALRWKKGLTYREMGRLLGVDGSTVNAWKKGKSCLQNQISKCLMQF